MSGRIRHSSLTRNQALKRLFTLQEFSIANYASQAHLHAGDGEREQLAVIVEIAKRPNSTCCRDWQPPFGSTRILAALGIPDASHRPELPECVLCRAPDTHRAARTDRSDPRMPGHATWRPRGTNPCARTLASEEENLWRLKRVLGEASEGAATLQMAA